MPFNPFSALTSKIYGGLALAAMIACGYMAWQLDNVRDERDNAHREVGRLEGKLDLSRTAIAQLEQQVDAQNEAIALLYANGQERAEAGKRALENARREGQKGREVVTILRERPSQSGAPEQCKTSDTLMQNRDLL